jgi:hypothetical protein
LVDLTEVTPATIAAVTTAIRTVFGASVIPVGGIQVRQRQYGLLQLKDWYSSLAGHLLGVPGVEFTDIDESRNRLRIGVAYGHAAAVRPWLQSLGIPLDATLIEENEPVVRLSHTVRSPVPAKQGGYVVTALLPNGIREGTMGFNAVRAGVPGFVTASHVTQVRFLKDTLGGYPATNLYQSQGYVPQYKVGTETVDPTGKPCKPPYAWSYNCRFSDSVFVAYDAGISWVKGLIARPVGLTVWNGQAPCAPANPQCIVAVDHGVSMKAPTGAFGITKPPSQPYLHGLQLQKVGKSSGWTRGAIEGTCTDHFFAADGVTLLAPTVLRCQYFVGNQFDTDAANDGWRIWDIGGNIGGDSGGPVFRLTSLAFKQVELYGIGWGGAMFSNSFGAKKFVFSPITGIAADLGPLDYVNPCMPPYPAC